MKHWPICLQSNKSKYCCNLEQITSFTWRWKRFVSSSGVKQWSTIGQSFEWLLYTWAICHCSLELTALLCDGRHSFYWTRSWRCLSCDLQACRRQKQSLFCSSSHKRKFMCREISDYLLNNDVRLPNGQVFTVEQFQLIGINLGGVNKPSNVFHWRVLRLLKWTEASSWAIAS